VINGDVDQRKNKERNDDRDVNDFGWVSVSIWQFAGNWDYDVVKQTIEDHGTGRYDKNDPSILLLFVLCCNIHDFFKLFDFRVWHAQINYNLCINTSLYLLKEATQVYEYLFGKEKNHSDSNGSALLCFDFLLLCFFFFSDFDFFLCLLIFMFSSSSESMRSFLYLLWNDYFGLLLLSNIWSYFY